MRGKPPLDLLTDLLETASQVAAELPDAASAARQELSEALAIAIIASLRVAAEYRAERKSDRRV
ncbi:MAG: hypothetical protein JSS00_08065 [Proteobacteria bacterium]|nr:hypothetical protein [Pseudomonadota bacterium]